MRRRVTRQAAVYWLVRLSISEQSVLLGADYLASQKFVDETPKVTVTLSLEPCCKGWDIQFVDETKHTEGSSCSDRENALHEHRASCWHQAIPPRYSG